MQAGRQNNTIYRVTHWLGGSKADTLWTPGGNETAWVGAGRMKGIEGFSASAYALMAQYPLSKRTYAYAAYLDGEIDPVAAGVVTQKNRNFGLGLVHNF